MSRTTGNAVEVMVKIIDTRYVQTDALSFKSVVQSLTGKDSNAVALAATPKEAPMLVLVDDDAHHHQCCSGTHHHHHHQLPYNNSPDRDIWLEELNTLLNVYLPFPP
ncbi:hypothetical protein Syun_028490 [Stephania yunnanensis]|uniref:VQ domain-containing protein n=1 Tax=Stephania yunnanensis TaxID=152371 RepID=A0AAP0ERD6_9MAGN